MWKQSSNQIKIISTYWLFDIGSYGNFKANQSSNCSCDQFWQPLYWETLLYRFKISWFPILIWRNSNSHKSPILIVAPLFFCICSFQVFSSKIIPDWNRVKLNINILLLAFLACLLCFWPINSNYTCNEFSPSYSQPEIKHEHKQQHSVWLIM